MPKFKILFFSSVISLMLLACGISGTAVPATPTTASPPAPAPLLNELATLLPGATEASSPTPAALPGKSKPVPTFNPTLANLPADVPVYPGATNLVTLNGGGIAFDVPDRLEVVAKYYHDKLTSNGWISLADSTVGAQTIQAWSKGRSVASVTIKVINGVTNVTIAVVSA